jgi:hypothetical protein
MNTAAFEYQDFSRFCGRGCLLGGRVVHSIRARIFFLAALASLFLSGCAGVPVSARIDWRTPLGDVSTEFKGVVK